MFFRLLILNKKYLLCALENEKTRSTFTNFFCLFILITAFGRNIWNTV